MIPITYQPEVWDVRTSDAGSLDVLPLLKNDDWPKLLSFMHTSWPDFNIAGDHGEHRAQAGERWWAVGAIEVKEGPALYQVQFRKDKMTYDRSNILSIFSWQGAPALPQELLTAPNSVPYRNEGVYSFSEGADSKGYPYGSASGPYWLWLWSDPEGPDWPDRRVGSDCLWGVHWFDNHVSLNPVFWPMREGGEPPPTGGMRIGYMFNGVIVGTVLLETGDPGYEEKGSLVVIDEDGDIVGYTDLE